jgi:hypothetical protein
VTTFAQPVVTLAPSAPIVLSVSNDNPNQLSLTTGGSAGAVTSVNGQTGAVTISALVNPMTTLGDTMYGGASGVVTRLPGDTSNIRKFLRELSSGGVAAAPAWDTLQASDIPALVQYALLAGATFTGQASPRVVSLSQSAGNVAVDASQGNDFRITLTASGWTIKTPTNPTDGQLIMFVLTQDGTGGRTVTWDTGYSFGSGTPPTLSVAAGAADLVGFKYVVAKSKWCATGSAPGY